MLSVSVLMSLFFYLLNGHFCFVSCQFLYVILMLISLPEFYLMVSCLLKHFIRKIKSNAVRRFDVSNIIIKNGEKVDVVAKKS